MVTGLFSIRNKLIASFMVTIIPIVLLGMFSYNTAKNSIQETAEQTSLETIKQVSKYIELSLGNITTLSTQIVVNNDLQEYMTKTKDEASYEMLNLQRDVSMNIQNMTFSTPNISSLTVLLENNRSILTTTVQIEKNTFENLSDSQILAKAMELNGTPFWVGRHGEVDKYLKAQPPYSLSCVRVLIESITGKRKGLLIIDMKPEFTEKTLKEINLGNNSELHLITPDQKDFAYRTIDGVSEALDTQDANNQIIESSIFSSIMQSGEAEGAFNSVYKGTDHLIIYSSIGNTGLTLVGIVPVENFSASASGIRGITVLFTLIAAVIAISIGLYMAFGMGRTINRIIASSNKAADGDLTVNLVSSRRDELGILTKSINTMISNMRKLIDNASNTAENVSESAKTVASTLNQVSIVSHEVTKTVQEIAEGASLQATDSDEGAKRMNDLALKINAVSDSAKTIESYSEDTINHTKQGLSSVQDLESKAKETTEITKTIITEIQSLENHSKSIDKIIKVIDSIAEQTNLLALNAAIEAARAGDAGRGFAVVADEVRKLAEQSTEATREIAAIISDTQNQTTILVERAISSENILESQNEAVENTLKAFKQISDSMELLARNVNDIIDIVSDMDNYKKQTITAIENISSVSQQIAASTQEVSASTQEQLSNIEELSGYANQLEATAKALNEAISKFKVR